MKLAHPVKRPSLLQIYRDFGLSIVTLAFWRWRPHWFLLLIMSVGIVATVMIVCTVPLFSDVMLTTGVRSVLTATPDANEIAMRVQTAGLSSATIASIEAITNPVLQKDIQGYLKGTPRLDFQTPEFGIVAPNSTNEPTRVYGTNIDAAASHITLVQGRLPGMRSDGIEILITPDTASALGLKVGSVASMPFLAYKSPTNLSNSFFQQYYAQTLKLFVVGLFRVKPGDAYWHGDTFEPDITDTGPHYSVFTSDKNLLAVFDTIARNKLGASEVFFSVSSQAYFYWYYYLDASRVSIDRINDLTKRLAQTQSDMTTTFSNMAQLFGGVGDIEKIDLYGSVLNTDLLPSSLMRFSSRVGVARIPAALLALQIIALILFFIIVMIEMLVDRQIDAIAILRSRGASGGQIFGSILTQGIVLSLIALFLGPLLAYIVVLFVVKSFLPLSYQLSLDVLTQNTGQTLVNIRWYALGAMALIIVVMGFALYRASRINVLAVRREAARSTQQPLWQRLHLDVGAALIALSGYGMTVYLTNVSNLLDVQTQAIVSAPLALIAPIFLLLAVVLLFLRYFPALLRLASHFVVRGRGAAPMLAIAQMARSPRQAIRMTALLALATAFAIFTLVFTSSQAQRVQDITSFQTGADFSGDSVVVPYRVPLPQQTALYRHIPGVLAASVAHFETDDLVNSDVLLPIRVVAVDTATLAQTIYWLPQNSTQPLPSLLAQLSAQRQTAIHTQVIPAIVDDYTFNKLFLHIGSTFTMHEENALIDDVTFRVIAVVQHIPTINNSLAVNTTSTGPLPGGIMIDFQSYAAVQQHLFGVSVPPEHVWLRTQSTPAALAKVRSALQAPQLQLENLFDRYAISDALGSDPLTVNLLVTLMLGAITTLLLAVIGDLLASWLSVRVRLTQFALLRAQGASPQQVVNVLLWEQGIVYTTALLLGSFFGALLALTVVPVLVFTGVPVTGKLSTLSDTEFYILQQTLPPRIVVPFSLVFAFIVLVAICLFALVMMARVVLHPSMSQVLRLDED